MKSKMLFGLVAMMVVLALAPSSFAQLNLTVFPQASQQEIATARNAQTGDPTSTGSGLLISGVILANSPLTTTGFFIDYPGIVSSSTTIPAADVVRLEGATGIFTLATISSINFGTGVIEITLPGTVGSAASTGGSPFIGGSVRIVGVRIDVNGLTAPIAAAFSLASTANNYLLSTASATVINALGAGMTAPVVGTRNSTSGSVGTGITVFTNRSLGPNGVTFTIAEGFASAWRTAAQQTSDPATRATPNASQIRLTWTGIATGMTLTIVSTGSSTTLGANFSSYTVAPTAAIPSPTTVITFVGTSLTTTETFEFDVTIAAPAAGAVFATSVMQVTATMFPIGTAVGDSLVPAIAGGYPVYAQGDVGPLTIGNTISASTSLLVPYAVSDVGFDTGLAIANTSADPFGGSVLGGASAASGAITISLYGRTATGATPTVVSLTTSATIRPGTGLDSSGILQSGSTWTALLSEIRTAAGQTGSFSGYIFIQVPFLNAHGTAFISDFRTFTSASNVLVLAPPSTASRTSPATGVETLGN